VVGDRLILNLTNALPEPTSLVINGQQATEAGAMAPTWTDGTIGARGGDPNRRVRSFTHEVAAPLISGATTTTSTATYEWDNLKPGTYLITSGSHIAIQVPMGLYAALKVDVVAGSQAYPDATTSNYGKDTVLLFSEVDPDLNAAVAAGSYGTPSYPTAISVGYQPKYFLINGASYPGITPPVIATPGGTALLRLLNAGLRSRVPTLKGGYVNLIAEDGNPLSYQKNLYSLELPPGKVLDAIIKPASLAGYSLYDRALGLTNGGVAFGGMLTSLNVSTPTSGVTLTPNPVSPKGVGTLIGFTAAGAGGLGTYEYQFRVRNPAGVWSVAQPYSPSVNWTWNTTGLTAGAYRVVVWARNSGSAANYETFAFVDYVLAPKAAGATLTPNPLSPQLPGTSVNFAATGTGGLGTYEYQFRVRNPAGTWSVAQPYSATANWTWNTTGLATGIYRVVVWVKNAGSAATYEALVFVDYVLAPPATGATLNATPVSPQAPGTSVGFAAMGSGGLGTYEYQFQLRNSAGVWSVQQAYSATSSWTWNTAGLPTGNYRGVVWVRNAGSSATYEAFDFLDYVLQ
jgi:FtsP/CotA-like multicopper oxidase with cupredoxin domain